MASVSCRVFNPQTTAHLPSYSSSKASSPALSFSPVLTPSRSAHNLPQRRPITQFPKGSGTRVKGFSGSLGEGLEGLSTGFVGGSSRVNMITWNKELIFNVAVPLGGGLIASAISAPNLKLYWNLKKPSWAPPAPLFGNVWAVIYALIGYAAWLVYRDGGGYSAQPGLWKLYGAQLIFNWLWQPLFFSKQLLGVAFIDLVLLWGTIAALIGKFSAVNTLAGKVLIPYLLWVTFAGALNFNLWQNNPAKDKDPKELQPKAA